jgi:hypothetical protein
MKCPDPYGKPESTEQLDQLLSLMRRKTSEEDKAELVMFYQQIMDPQFTGQYCNSCQGLEAYKQCLRWTVTAKMHSWREELKKEEEE